MAKTEEILLPKPNTTGKISLEVAIAKRRSQRDFTKQELSQEQISQLLWAAQGITGRVWNHSFRSAPSAGALYPMEIYLVSKEGIFHYLPEGHKLEELAETDLRRDLSQACLGQGSLASAPINIIICAVYSRITAKYAERGIRYAHIEAGHIAQNIHLEAVALGLGSVPIGAFSDERVRKLLNLPKGCEPLYIIPVGYPKE